MPDVPHLHHFRRAVYDVGYYVWAALVCEVRGHDIVHSIDTAEGFDTYWCRRCAEGNL